MKNKLTLTLIGLTLTAIAGCSSSEDLKYNRGNVEVEAKLRSEEVEKVAFNSGCYRVIADKQRIGYEIKVVRRVDLVTGVPIGDCGNTLPEIAQLVSRVSNYFVPNLHCSVYDKNGNKSDIPASSAQQVDQCSGQALKDTEDCLTKMISADERMKCEYR